MFQPSTLIPLLLLTSTASARLGSDLSGRHAHAAPHKKAAAAAVNAVKDYIPDFEKIRRTGVDEMRKRTGLGGEKKKRKVKKRANTCRPQVPLNPGNNATASVSASASSSASSSIIGNEHLATDGATSQWGSATASASNSWQSASASNSWQSASSTASSAGASSTGSYNSPWTLTETWQGSNFFDNFNFWEWDDPTHGTVDYVGASEAWNSGLISINNQGHAIMTVDQTKQISGGRKAVRIHGNLVYTGGMVLMDAVHMPTGCGTWPAWWSNGPNWPYGGEIDILEGVNAFNQNQVSLHTGPGCTMTNPVQTGQLTTGNYDNTNCDSFATSNSGCGVRDLSNDNSYGAAFNSIGGGVYATKWDKTGVSIWWFPRNQIPDDILADQPMPSTWGTPVGNFPATTCNPYQFMYDHFNIFTNTFCGDWAGADGIWNYAGYAGQDQSCAAMTGYSTCQAYVQNEGQNFNNAYWEVSYIKYFNSTSEV